MPALFRIAQVLLFSGFVWLLAALSPLLAADSASGRSPNEVCAWLFEQPGGTFDATAAYQQCRQAAELGDAAASLRVGFLSLAGLGTQKDLDAAARRCTEAQSRDPAISAGFCLAAVAEEARRSGAAVTPEAHATSPAPANTAASVALRESHERAQRGDRAAAARLCEFYFGGKGGAFEPLQAADWCRRAAYKGDAGAMRRLGLMRLWGLGTERSTAQAEALCQEAQARDSTISAAFCLAAVGQERTAKAAAAAPTHFARSVPPAAEQTSESKALGFDRALASVHTTATGLQFRCRDLLKWATYEQSEGLAVITQNTRILGRPILDYRDEDYTALDHAAAQCAAAIAPYDEDGSNRQYLAQFRKMVPLIKARQREVDREKRVQQADNPRCNEVLRSSRAHAHRLLPGNGQAEPWTDGYSCYSGGRSRPDAGGAPSRTEPARSAAGGR